MSGGGVILAGIALAAAGFTGRYLIKNKQLVKKMSLPITESGIFSKYYRGGFEPKMTRNEAALILGVPYSARAERIKEAHKKLMIINHPDKGGSPYLAMKINEAKDMMDAQK